MTTEEAQKTISDMDAGDITWDDNLRAEANNIIGGGGGGSLGGIDLSQVPSVQEFVQNQFASEDPYLQALLSKMSSFENPYSVYQRLEGEAGIPELRGASRTLSKEIAAIEDYLDQIEPGVSKRTTESMMTEAQRAKLVSEERKPHEQVLAKLGTGLGRVREGLSEALQGIGTKTGLILQGQQQELEPIKMAYQTMVDRNVRLLTGFTEDRQLKIETLFDALSWRRELDSREWQELSDASAAENEYYRGLQTTAVTLGLNLTGQENVSDLLEMIGNGYAEQIAYEREQDAASSSGIDLGIESESMPTTPPTGINYSTSPTSSFDWDAFELGIINPEDAAWSGYQE